MKTKYFVFFVTLLAVVLLDQFLKLYISSHFLPYESVGVIPGFLDLTHVKNPGAAFGFLADAPPVFRSFFLIIVTLIAMILILYFIAKGSEREVLLTFSLSLIMGGALGNLIDRVRYGEVIDFLDFYFASYHWPAFNVADTAITIGALLLLYEIFRRRT